MRAITMKYPVKQYWDLAGRPPVRFCRAAALTIGIIYSVAANAGELGANKFDLFLQYLPPSAPTPNAEGYHYITRAMAKKAIADARDAGLAFLRVAVTGYWPVGFGNQPNDLAMWQKNP